MIHLQTSTLGVMDTPQRQNEYMLVVAAIDCAKRDRADWLAEITPCLMLEHITDPYLRSLYCGVLAIVEAGEPVAEAVLMTKLPATGEIFGKRLADLYGLWADSASQGGNIVYYAKRVFQEFRRTHSAVEIAGAADDMNRTTDPDSVLDQLPGIASKYAPLPENRVRDNRQVFQDIIDELDGKKISEGMTYGIASLDRAIDGIPPGSLTVIGAQSSHGKSALMGQMSIRCAKDYGKPVLYYTFEMSQADMYKRWASVLSRQPVKGGDRRQYTKGLSRVYQLAETDRLLHVFTGAKTVEQIAFEVKAKAKLSQIGLIVVDYIQLVDPTNTKGITREQQVAHIVQSLKRLASDTGVPVLTASQLNEDGRTRESREIRNTANFLIKIEPDPAAEKKPVARVDFNIDKSRDGAQDVGQAIWEKTIYTFRDEDTHDMPNYDAGLDDVAADSLPGIVNQARREQPDWS